MNNTGVWGSEQQCIQKMVCVFVSKIKGTFLIREFFVDFDAKISGYKRAFKEGEFLKLLAYFLKICESLFSTHLQKGSLTKTLLFNRKVDLLTFCQKTQGFKSLSK